MRILKKWQEWIKGLKERFKSISFNNKPILEQTQFMEINKHSIVEEVVQNICEDCKSCSMDVINPESGEDFVIEAKYCKDGSGYVDVTLYTTEMNYVDSCKLKHPGDACLNPFSNYIPKENAECECLSNQVEDNEGELLN